MEAQPPLKVDLVIPAFNEQLCIADILQDVVSAKQKNWFRIQNIFVISDASIDQTDAIVTEFSRSDKRVKLIRKPRRKGKNDSINKAIHLTKADALVMLDADVRLANTNTLKRMVFPIWKTQASLAGARVIPLNPGGVLNPAVLARHFDSMIENEKRRRKAISYWSFYGRALAMSRKLFKNLRLPDSQADDLFIYYSCKKYGQKFAPLEDAVVFFKAPCSVRDFINQYSRFLYYTEKARRRFGRKLVSDDMRVGEMVKFFLAAFIRHPYMGLMWYLCNLTSRMAYLVRHKTSGLERGLYKTNSGRVVAKQQ